MDEKKLKDHIRTLSELHGPSGYEGPVREHLREVWQDLVDRFEVDGLGSLVGIKHGTGPEPRKRIMLCAHMDEIAFLVQEVRDGYIKLHNIWGNDSRINLAKPVVVHTSERTLKGVIGAIPPHISNQTGETKEYTPLDQQWVDVGLPAEEVEAMVDVGDIVVMDAPMLELQGDRIAGKALDDRAAVASVTACLEYLQGRNHSWDVYAVASAQEEVGVRGAQTSAYHVKPDAAIAIDVTFAQQPGVSGDERVKLGDGPTIGIGPNFHPGLYDGLHEAAKRIEVSLFVNAIPGRSGTDARAIQVSNVGVPTALLGIPVRNMHSSVETASLKDIDRTGRLMAEFVAGLADDYLDTFEWDEGDGDK